MSKEMEDRNTHILYEKDKIGEVQIADEVVAIIAGLAATEVEGVDSMAGNITNELVGKLGMKNLSKGVKVTVTEEHVSYVINTIDINQHNTRLDGYEIRRTAVENNVTIFTALETVQVLLDVLEEITFGVSTIDAK